jgi:hypothetical protein
LTNLRFRFHDGDLFGKYMAYPDVSLPSEFELNANERTAQLFDKVHSTIESFEEVFKDIIWISYRKNFPPLHRHVEGFGQN